MARRQPKVPDTKKRLLRSATEVFSDRGFTSTGVDQIVERAHTSRGAFYYYFSSTADVARDVQEELWTAAGGRPADVVDPEADFLTKARSSLEVYLTALNDLGSEREFLRQGFADPTLVMLDDEGKKWGTHFVRALLDEAMAKGQIPHQDLEKPTSLLVEALQELTLAALNGDDVAVAVHVIDELNQAVMFGKPVELVPRASRHAPTAEMTTFLARDQADLTLTETSRPRDDNEALTSADLAERAPGSSLDSGQAHLHAGSVITYALDDSSYLDWIGGHPKGFVINHVMTPSPSYAVLHRATCSSIRGSSAPGKQWTRQSHKVVSLDRDDLTAWVLNVLVLVPSLCGMCRPCVPVTTTPSFTRTART